MIAFLTLCYCSIIWLIFYKLKLLPFNLVAKFIVGIIGIGGILTLLILMNVYQPYSDDFLVYQPVARIGDSADAGAMIAGVNNIIVGG